MGYRLATAGFNIAANPNPIRAITATQNAIAIARTIHGAMSSLSVSFASWERSADDQQQLLASQTFKPIPAESANLPFAQELTIARRPAGSLRSRDWTFWAYSSCRLGYSFPCEFGIFPEMRNV